jgi:hypothetical protein
LTCHGSFLSQPPHALAGAQTDPPPVNGAQHPLLHCEPEVHAMAQRAPSEPPMFTQ